MKKRVKELQKREAELKTSAAEWARRGDVHSNLVFNLAHVALAKAKLKPPRTFKEAKIADEMARKARGLDEGDSAQRALLIHINELDAGASCRLLLFRISQALSEPCAGRIAEDAGTIAGTESAFRESSCRWSETKR